jgi:hypothetical protein
MMKKMIRLALFGFLMASAIAPSFADDAAKIQATIGRLGKVCKDKLMTSFKGVPMSDLHVNLGATLQQSIDSGEITLADIQKDGLSFDVEVPGKGAGYCNVNGKGKITQVEFH